ncbi:hypothetical protein [Hufsiella arboris]|uniref:hypothetical protein n=1 Tax=Hufsiella arboris TaxID=2695275 RepID=UPI001928367D|nr:hypothetical protein [Hufsiella arboris]
MEEATRKRIIRNVLLSLLIYALPVLLMFLTFYLTGQKPWKDKTPNNKSSINH